MTEFEKNERIKAVEEQMAELQKELEDIRNAETTPEWDFSAWDNIPVRKKYEFTVPLDPFMICSFNEKLDKLTKLMKFKFCYDYSYNPDWSNEDELKWYVHFNTQIGEYKTNHSTTWGRPSMVYFSSEEIAQKCADWLNAGCPEE